MMKPYLPHGFEDRLDSMFDNRLRIRWSHKRNEWHLEYKIARGKVVNFPIRDQEDDMVIRAKDGYAFIMAIQPGDRMACPKCRSTLKVPIHKMAETRCDYCIVNGRDGRVTACYFDLNGELIFEHLRKIDPIRDWRKNLVKLADENNARILASKERDALNKLEAATKDNFKDLVGIPTFGYTKEFRG